MNDTNAKQQIVERIKKSNNILVTVSNDPSVDELSAALGLTIMLNKMEKHATAVFSGAIPPAITFLEPDKTFESTVDSLRDFIIALNKEKADHLRYKLDGDVVKIFITPYRTTITSDDLEFSQGDYNVELVLALGIKNKDHLDAALAAHGRILHDATVVTMNAGGDPSDLGSIDWTEAGASSLSEMLVGLSDALKLEKGIVDEQIATAFMTGLVAATERFSNNKTSSKVMTVAAQLMAAGANQQLIALKLSEGAAGGETAETTDNADGTTDLAEGAPTKLKKTRKAKPAEPAAEPTPAPKKNDGSLTISHDNDVALAEAARETAAEQAAEAAALAEAELAQQQAAQPAPAPADADQALADELATVAPAGPAVTPLTASDLEAEEPSMGGTLNATTEQAAEESRRELESSRNHTILSHGGEYIGDQTPTFQAPLNAASEPDAEASPSVGLFGASTDAPAVAAEPPHEKVIEPPVVPAPTTTPAADAVLPPVVHEPTLAEIDAQHRTPQDETHDQARAAVEAAFGAVHYEPAPIPVPVTPPVAAEPETPQASTPPPIPVMPPMPDFSTLPPEPAPLPPLPPVGPFGSGPEAAPEEPTLPPPQPPTDPGQFQIPGQQ